LKQAVDILSEKGRFSAAANNQKQIAELYETDLQDLEKAMDAYNIAAEWYHGEDSKSYPSIYALIIKSGKHVLSQGGTISGPIGTVSHRH
jgi:hypothetical protein